MESSNREIIYQGNSVISVETLPNIPHQVIVKNTGATDAAETDAAETTE